MLTELASFGMSLMKLSDQNNQDWTDYYRSRDTANRQVAMNNNLAYNSYLHINEEQQLSVQKQHLDVNALNKAIRAAQASEKAKIESQGGDSELGSGLARIQNIQRDGYEALARKDLNFKIALGDFRRRRKNTELSTLDKNNKAFSGLTAVPDSTGLVTQAIGLGIDKYAKVGFYTAADGKIKSRFSGSG